MLQAFPTQHGTGVKILGDYGDLTSLYDTITELFDEEQNDIAFQRTRILTVLSYEIRHAFQHDRLCEEFRYDNDNIVIYYGFKVDWITLLFSICCLRYNASFKIINEVDQYNLYLLEFLCKDSMKSYDLQGGSVFESFINTVIPVHDKLIYLLHQHIVNEFFRMRTGKQRFREIPNLIHKYCGRTPLHLEIQEDIEKMIKDKNSSISSIESDYPYIDVKW